VLSRNTLENDSVEYGLVDHNAQFTEQLMPWLHFGMNQTQKSVNLELGMCIVIDGHVEGNRRIFAHFGCKRTKNFSIKVKERAE
jgi:hypothetical protein